MIRALALVLALAGSAAAQLVPTSYRDFSGGYVDNVDPVNLKPNESPSMLNVSIDDPVGSLKPRRGMTLCGNLPSGNKPTALYEYTKSDGTRRLIASDNATVYSTPDCQTWTTIVEGLSSASQVHFATVRDTLWIVNGSTWATTWDGTTRTPLDGRANTPSPTVPKCAFVEFWKERVWCGAPLGDVSAVAYSALTDSNGNDLDPSTGTLSWPAANVFQIDQNAGSRLYGLKAYRNRLYAFKDNGVWEIGFDNDFNNFVRKTYASVGSRYQTSITEVDGVLYFTGRDGIYAFDGDNAIRISEKIKNKFLTLNQPLISQNYKTWTTQSEFEGGTLNQASASDTPGSVTLSSAPAALDNGGFESGALSPFTSFTSQTGTDLTLMVPGVGVLAGSISGTYSSSVTIRADTGFCSGDPSLTLNLYNASGSTLTAVSPAPTTTVSTYTLNTSAWAGQTARLHWVVEKACVSNPSYGTSVAEMTSPEITLRSNITFQQIGCASESCPSLGNYVGWTEIDNIQSFQYYSTGSWTSEVYNAVAVSTWGALSATSVDNGGSITYEVKVGSDTGAVAARPWVTIAPGALINGTSDQIYVQVRATLNASSGDADTPELQDVQVAWNSGGNNTQKIYGYGWRNSLWVAASSGSATTNNIVLQRARAPLDAWMLHDFNIGPMATFNDVFYAGASTHSAIYRMDYGTNDNGAAIKWHWESKDENYGAPNNPKMLREINIDYRANSSCNIRAGYVRNNETTYCVGNLPSPNALLSYGAGSRRLFFNGDPAYTIRTKVCDDQLDQSPTIMGITPYATGIPKRGD